MKHIRLENLAEAIFLKDSITPLPYKTILAAERLLGELYVPRNFMWASLLDLLGYSDEEWL